MRKKISAHAWTCVRVCVCVLVETPITESAMQASLEAKLISLGVVLHPQMSEAEMAEKMDQVHIVNLVLVGPHNADTSQEVEQFAQALVEERASHQLVNDDHAVYALKVVEEERRVICVM